MCLIELIDLKWYLKLLQYGGKSCRGDGRGNGGGWGSWGDSINHQNSFEEKKALLEELERGGVEGVEDMAVEKCPACGVAWIEQLLNRSRWTTSFTLQIQLFFSHQLSADQKLI